MTTDTEAKTVTFEQQVAAAKEVRAKMATATGELAKMLARNQRTAGFYSDQQIASIKAEIEPLQKTFDGFPTNVQAEAGGLTAQRRLVADEVERLMKDGHTLDHLLNQACKNLNRSKSALAEDNTELHVSTRQFVRIKDGHARKPPTASYMVSISAKSRGLK